MTDKIVRRLGDRLNHIFEWLNTRRSYHTIWDVCCDHGRLGLHLHKRHLNSEVFLVDKVATIIHQLEADFGCQKDGRLHFMIADGAELSVASEKSTLVIIAGVGGQSLVQMLAGMLARINSGQSVDFILSPNSHTFALRAFLQQRRFSLIEEAFVTEQGFSHEHMWLRYFSEFDEGEVVGDDGRFVPVSAVGDSLWYDMTDVKHVYIRKLLQHFHRMQVNTDSELAVAALKAYGHLL